MIPDLRERPQWLNWRWPSKAPLSPHGGAGKVNDPATWGTYREALARFDTDGIGFALSPDDPFVGIDIDGCVSANGRVHNDAHAILDLLNGYWEWSPSGSGLHIFVRGTLPWRGRSTKGRPRERQTPWGDELAIFGYGKFFTMTDNGRGEIREAQAELNYLISYYFPEPDEKPPVARSKPVSDDDVELLERMFTGPNGDRIRALYEGDISGHGNNRSSADLALCNHLCFYTGNDFARVDTLFRRSGLMREKWLEKRGDGTYGSVTIERAMKGGV